MTFEILALVCALGQDPRECMPPTARVVEKIGEEHSELACLRQGALSAGGATVKPGEGEYLKLMCVRRPS